MGLKEKAGEIRAKIVARIDQAVVPVLQPGERVEARMPAISGPSMWVAFWFLGPLGMMIFQKSYFVTLTDRRLIFIKASKMGNARGFAFEVPRAHARVLSVKQTGAPWLMTDIRIAVPDGKRLHLHIARGKAAWGNGFAAEAQALVAALPR